MGQKVLPTGLRVGIVEDWRSRWYARKGDFSRYLGQDYRIRKHIKKNYRFAAIAKIEIERKRDEVKIILHTARAGLIIGRRGSEIEKLTSELSAIAQEKVNLVTVDIEVPELSAQLVAESIADQLAKRAAFRRTIKKAVDASRDAGALGIKVQVSGRLGGSEIARTEKPKAVGMVPLHTLRAVIDYGFSEAFTTYGTIGVKVWIYKGQQLSEKERYSAINAQEGQVSQGAETATTGSSDAR